MKKTPFNDTLLDEFPVLKQTYDKIKGGAFDLDTPASNFHEGVFVPYFEEQIQKGNEKEIQHCCDYVESLLNNEDEVGQNIAISAILCVLYDQGIDLSKLPLGIKSLQYYQNWLKD